MQHAANYERLVFLVKSIVPDKAEGIKYLDRSPETLIDKDIA